MSQEIYNIVLIHTARTWERMRLTQTYQEMPFDNIASTDEIEEIASTIYDNDIIQGFLTDEIKDDYWINNTAEGMSDIYIEAEAERIINDEILT
tara:strand:- start:111 stop:392 length:282 start_codon:yes stop_codon:yes gene_type:complete